MVAMTADLSAEQQRVRRQGIGASEVAAVCGLSPWAGPLDIYLSKKGLRLDMPDTDDQRFGKAAELMTRELYAVETGRLVTLPEPRTMRHPALPLVIATPDWIADGVTTCQAKAPRHSTGWGESGTHDFPEIHWLQITWEMAAAQLQEADLVAYLAFDRGIRIYPHCRFDADFFGEVYERVAQFWRDHIEADVPPPVDGSRAAGEYLKGKFPKEKHAEYITDHSAAFIAIVAEFVALRDDLKQKEPRKKELYHIIAERIGDHAGALAGDYSVSYKSRKVSALDKESLFASFRISPADVAAHTTQGSTRVLTVTAKKGK